MPHDLRVTSSVSGIVLISGIALQTSSQKQSISIAASNQASDKLLANLQNRNVPIQSEGIVPNDGLVHIRQRIPKKKVEEQFKDMECVVKVSVFLMLLGNFVALRLMHNVY
jgi:hypothetical protein